MIDIKQVINLASQGNAECQAFLSQAYYYGQGGVEKNYKKALEWAQKAFDNGEKKDAPMIIAMCLLNGQGIAVNKDLGYQFLCFAADNGNEIAMEFKERVRKDIYGR